MREAEKAGELYADDIGPAYRHGRSSGFGNWLRSLVFCGSGIASALYGGLAEAGTKFHKYQDKETKKETHVRIDYPDRVVDEGECAVTIESEDGLWTIAVAVSAPDDRADITDAKCLRKIKLTKIGEQLFDPGQEGVWRDANKKSYGTLELNVGNAKFALKVLDIADRVFKHVYGERFAKDFPPELFAEGMEATTLWMRRESGDLLNVPYYGARYIVKLRFHGKEEGEEIPVYVSVWPFNINEKFPVKFEGTPVSEKPKEKPREKPEKPRREEAPARRGKSKLSDLARVDADGWVYPDGVDRNRDGSYKYDLTDPEEVFLADCEARNNNDGNLLLKVLENGWVEHLKKKTKTTSLDALREFLQKIKIEGPFFIKYRINKIENVPNGVEISGDAVGHIDLDAIKTGQKPKKIEFSQELEKEGGKWKLNNRFKAFAEPLKEEKKTEDEPAAERPKPVHGMIVVDGKKDDWEKLGIKPLIVGRKGVLYPTPSGSNPDYADIESLSLALDGTNLYGLLRCYGPVQGLLSYIVFLADGEGNSSILNLGKEIDLRDFSQDVGDPFFDFSEGKTAVYNDLTAAFQKNFDFRSEGSGIEFCARKFRFQPTKVGALTHLMGYGGPMGLTRRGYVFDTEKWEGKPKKYPG